MEEVDENTILYMSFAEYEVRGCGDVGERGGSDDTQMFNVTIVEVYALRRAATGALATLTRT